MFKKIIAAAAIAASAAFATWDYFPVQEAGKGTLHGGLYYDWHHEWSQAGLNLGARYTVIQNLELSLQGWGYQFWSEVDCQGCTNGGDGLRDLTIGGRYQITPMVSGFIDLRLPIGNDDDGVNGHPPSNSEVSIYLGGQFSMPIQGVQGLSFGTEAGLDWGFEHDNYERGLEIHIAGEMDFAVPNQIFIPYLGLKFKLQLTEDTWEDDKGNEWGADDSGDSQFNLWLGCKFALNPQILLDARLIFRSGDMDGDATGLYAGVDFNF
ncbi:hypothetical protein SAMN05720766_11248 [Fibrobacter sp. UWH9]|uniref:hypothetical protein n=1 Tax=unclassified Fibrobacter TaxID=2634177 RepID=UPI000913AB2F|nr:MULTISPECIES: hypothetical protein [Fibrobacter]MCQ2099841.1 hypothetical protein [Fibrobacter sp.]MCL4101672.1 hypothetical protein [Fibrobacter succinogenes]MDO4946416.1 hypothetical protein [Fibrobacter sp.]OWV04515.1 hypothetical protein B7993_10870 [Fibrobacter sp. UWH3]OWV14772.1 hypothetical protein B7992_07485 [Fibrobacter sp. UWH1]